MDLNDSFSSIDSGGSLNIPIRRTPISDDENDANTRPSPAPSIQMAYMGESDFSNECSSLHYTDFFTKVILKWNIK